MLRTLGRLESTIESPLGDELRSWMHRARLADLERPDVEALVKAVLDVTFDDSHPTERTSKR